MPKGNVPKVMSQSSKVRSPNEGNVPIDGGGPIKCQGEVPREKEGGGEVPAAEFLVATTVGVGEVPKSLVYEYYSTVLM